MKNFNKIIKHFLILIIITGLISCDDKIRELEDLDSPPTFMYFRKSSITWEIPTPDEIIIDSAKTYNQINNSSYPAVIKVVNNLNNLTQINIIGSDPQSSIFVNNSLYNNSYTSKTDADINLAFRSPIASTQVFSVTSTDIFNKKCEIKFKINFKENKPPKPILKLILVNGSSSNYQLKASESYDIDNSIGGMIVEYQFIIDNIIINTSEANINHFFKKGIHKIKLRVKDNDSVWSEYIEKDLIVN